MDWDAGDPASSWWSWKGLVASMCGVTPLVHPYLPPPRKQRTLWPQPDISILWSHLWRLVQYFLLPWPQESGVWSLVQSFHFQKVALITLGPGNSSLSFLGGRCWNRMVQKEWPACQMLSVKGAVATLSWHLSTSWFSFHSTTGMWRWDFFYDVWEHTWVCLWKLWKASVKLTWQILQPLFVKVLLLLIRACHCFKQIVFWFADFLKSGNEPHCFFTIWNPKYQWQLRFGVQVTEKTQIKFDLETSFLCKEPLEMHKWSLLSSGMARESCLLNVLQKWCLIA